MIKWSKNKWRRLECTTGGHNRYWMIRLLYSNSVYLVETMWGRIGSSTTQKNYEFLSLDDASEFMGVKIQEKLKKGYVEVEINKDKPVPPTSGILVDKIFKTKSKSTSKSTTPQPIPPAPVDSKKRAMDILEEKLDITI